MPKVDDSAGKLTWKKGNFLTSVHKFKCICLRSTLFRVWIKPELKGLGSWSARRKYEFFFFQKVRSIKAGTEYPGLSKEARALKSRTYTVTKRLAIFPSPAGLVTSRLGTGKSQIFFTVWVHAFQSTWFKPRPKLCTLILKYSIEEENTVGY